MNKKSIVIMIAVILLSLAASGCQDTENYKDTTSGQEAKMTEENQNRLLTASPPPELSQSLERENLIRRLELLNDEDKIFYVYLVDYGKVMTEYVAKGKISSVNSKLTTQEQIVDDPFGRSYDVGGKVVESPDLDGSYGTNGDAIFFFTTEGAYVEWAGNYICSDFPLSMTTPPELVRMIE